MQAIENVFTEHRKLARPDMVRRNATGKHATEEWTICHMQMYIFKNATHYDLAIARNYFLNIVDQRKYAPQQRCAEQCL